MATCNPIVALDVLAFDNEPASFSGKVFQYIPIDVNMGAGGKYIYIGYRRGVETETVKPITSIEFKAYPKKQTVHPKDFSNYLWYAQDLNAGAGGEYIYMFSSTDPNKGDPILDVIVGFLLNY
ncbi:MAG: hypothetical protein RIT27_1593 [Pseudomonadota bacterium]